MASTTVTTKTINRADVTDPIALDMGKLNSMMADTTLEVVFYEDGRLKSINSEATGKGDQIVKSALELAKLAGVGTLALDGGPFDPKAICKVINAQKEKVVTLEYAATINPAEADTWDLPVNAETGKFLETIGGNASYFAITAKKTGTKVPSIETKEEGPGIRVTYPALVELTVEDTMTALWTSTFAVPQLGAKGWMPITKAPAFGKNTTKLELNEDGSLAKVTYGAESGTKAALDTAGEVVDEVNSKTDAERAADAEAEMKAIKAEQALVKCKADPANCT
ncbi:hypothetical protein [Croceicoccus gelatinilyticus]|uniref:hypothetical protein n=1 Tax=Croceicoccus gelatinilyticus TaxID=2835536 RepID=UPI001BD0412C|nr:hypothetical protein [Croceicoccus gelatinilyticus]MBS7671401.1 hypothetical protein [Croceicoccus gelatinilyticus]